MCLIILKINIFTVKPWCGIELARCAGMMGQECFAVTVWGGRVSPVLDVSTRAILLTVEDGHLIHRVEVKLPEPATAKLAALVDHGVRTLLCGAVSRTLAQQAASFGLQLVPFLAGDMNDVIAGHMAGRLRSPEFAMPGCRGRWRGRGRGPCRRRGHDSGKESNHAQRGWKGSTR